MDPWAALRQRACACRDAAARSGATTPSDLLHAAFANVALEVRGFDPGEPGFPHSLRGRLERDPMLVYVSRALAANERLLVLAHELGHFHLHDDPVLEDTLESATVEGAGRRLSGYSPREVKELQAEAFAAEFLCPSQHLRDEVIRRGTPASKAAAALGVPVRLVLRQATAALLRPPVTGRAGADALPEPELARDLLDLAAWDGPALVISGSGGTGKTTAVRARLRHLAANGAEPAQLLVLVRSEDAAESLRETLASTRPAFACEAWIGTPRSLGVEIVSRWPEAIPRRPDFRILAAGDARRLLGTCLARIYNQRGLPSPSERHVAATMRAMALAKAGNGGSGQLVVDRAAAAAYADALREEDALDVGDLLPAAVRILQEHPEALRAIQGRFRHVVIDDAQDLTRAAAGMIDLVVPPNGTLWAARDPTSAIHLFEGADPNAIADLVARRGGCERTLMRRHAAWGAAFGAELRFRQWLSRPSVGRWPVGDLKIPLSIAPDEDGEARAVADEIEALRRVGIPHREQAVLGRTHATINRMAARLDQAGVPILHLGDMRERGDVRSLLALLSIAIDGTSAGLREVVGIDRYAMTARDVEAIRRWCETQGGSLRPALAAPHDVPGIDAASRAVLATMNADVAGFECGSSPFETLATWLFERTAHCHSRGQPSADLRARLSLVAIHHVLMACEEAEVAGDATPRGVAERIDRIGTLDQDTHFRKVDLSATGLDAVSVMTFHAAQGRQFRAVHVVGCTASRRRRADDRTEAQAFLVGLSRASERVHLSRPETRNGRSVEPSRFLEGIAGLLAPRQTGRPETS